MAAPLASGATTDQYQPPIWDQGSRNGKSVPEQIVRSLAKSRRWGRTFAQAWPVALENTQYPKERATRHDWQRLLASPEGRRPFELAYHRLPVGADMNMLHAAIEPRATGAATADCNLFT